MQSHKKQFARKWKNRKPKRQLLLFALTMIVTLSLALAGYLYARGDTPRVDRLVTFHDRGEERVILTHAQSVREALKDADIAVDPHDIVEPALGSELLSTDSAVIIYRARPVLVIDGVVRQKIMTPAQSPSEIARAAGLDPIGRRDKTTLKKGDLVTDGASTVLTIKRSKLTLSKVVYVPNPKALTKSRGAQLYTDSSGVAHRETYYDLPMNVVINHCGPGNSYSVRAADGAKIDKDGYVLVAANYHIYPRCTIVETSLGPGKVYDTGGFALRYPHGFDLATDWTNYDGR